MRRMFFIVMCAVLVTYAMQAASSTLTYRQAVELEVQQIHRRPIAQLETIALKSSDIPRVEACMKVLAEREKPPRNAITNVINGLVLQQRSAASPRLLAYLRDLDLVQDGPLVSLLRRCMGAPIDWRSKVAAAELLATQGDADAVDFLIAAYTEPRVLLPVEPVREAVREALCRCPADEAIEFLIARFEKERDAGDIASSLALMVSVRNPQSLQLARWVLDQDTELDYILLVQCIEAFAHFGTQADLRRLRAISQVDFLSNFAADDEGRASLQDSVRKAIAQIRGRIGVRENRCQEP